MEEYYIQTEHDQPLPDLHWFNCYFDLLSLFVSI